MRLSLSTLSKTLLTAMAMMLWKAEARWGNGNGGGRAPVTGSDAPSSNLKAEQLEEAARKAANNIVVWGTTTLFQLKESAHMKKSMARSRTSQGISPSQESVKVDTLLSKQIVEGAIGGVLIMMNSPALGKMGDAIKRLMTDQRRQLHILQLHSQLREAHGANLGSGGPSKDPVGFWEGALRNKELAAAHDKYMSDIEALANSGLAKRAGESAEAYHEAMLKYASSESFQSAAKQ